MARTSNIVRRHSLKESRTKARTDLMRIYAAAVAAVDPFRAMLRVLDGDSIRKDESGGAKSGACETVGVSENVRPLIERSHGVRLLAIGKAQRERKRLRGIEHVKELSIVSGREAFDGQASPL